jgi:DUF4097 and DUF4098 domain-containing protein YvlB
MRTLLKTTLAVLLVIFALSSFSAFETTQDGKPYQVKEFTITTPGKLNVETSGGSISVNAHNADRVIVEMHIRKGNTKYGPDDAEARKLLEDYTINISQSGNAVSAVAERKSSGWFSNSNNVSISFVVQVPQNMACNLSTSGGSLTLKGVNGSQTLRTSGGSITLGNINGNADARTSGGSITVNSFDGNLDARTSGGSISLQQAKGDLALRTSGGSIKLDNVRGSIEASTSGGSIKANLLALDKQLKLSTSGGSISATVPSGLGMDLNLSGNRVNTKLTNFNGQAEKDRVKGSMNGGGIPIVMSTTGGSVNLDYR